MDDTSKPDPILQQVPLIRNVAYQPPKPVTLSTNYGRLLPTLPNSVVPPKINASKDALDSIKSDLEQMKADYLNEDRSNEQVSLYSKWLADSSRKVAPGFDFDIMKPTKNNGT